jgi:hypothetical protein
MPLTPEPPWPPCLNRGGTDNRSVPPHGVISIPSTHLPIVVAVQETLYATKRISVFRSIGWTTGDGINSFTTAGSMPRVSEMHSESAFGFPELTDGENTRLYDHWFGVLLR